MNYQEAVIELEKQERIAFDEFMQDPNQRTATKWRIKQTLLNGLQKMGNHPQNRKEKSEVPF